MLDKKCSRFIQILCLASLTACQIAPVEPVVNGDAASDESASAARPVAPTSAVSESEVPASETAKPTMPESAAYREAINLASGAFTLGQQAQSPDDWDLVVGRWEQAIEKLEAVPPDHPQYDTAQAKLRDYERSLTQAQQQLAKAQRPPDVVLAPRSPAAVKAAPSRPALDSSAVPIVERRGGTPIINVSFNGRSYPMVLDTGASHTHIPRAMANELGIQVVGQATVATASSRQVAVDVGYVDSIQVGTITRRNIPVSIGDALPIGLLGNDVYRNFDVILQVNSVEFRPR